MTVDTLAPDALLNALLGATPHGLLVLQPADDDWHVVRLNPAATADGLRDGQSLTHWLSAEDAATLQTHLRTAHHTANPLRLELPAPMLLGPTAAGRWLDATFSALPADTGGAVLIMFQDVTARRQAEAEQQAEAATYRQIMDNALTAIAHLTAVRDPATGQILDFRYEKANKMVAELARQPLSAIVGRTLLDLYPGTRASGLFDKWIHVVETGEPLHYQEHYLFADTDVWYETRALRWGDGLIESYLDITPRKQAEQQVVEQATRFQFTMDNAPTGLVLYRIVRDASGNVVDLRYELINRHAERLVGQPISELLGRGMLDAFPVLRNSPVWLAYRQLAETGEPLHRQNQYADANVQLWYDVQGQRHGDYVVLSFLNITDLKTAEDALLRQSSVLEGILDNLPITVFVSEAVREQPGGPVQDFVIRHVNETALRAYNAQRSDMVGKLASVLFPYDRASGIFDRYVAVLASGEAQTFEWPYNDAHGQPAWLFIQLAPLDEERVVASALDITRIKASELENRHQAEQLAVMNHHLLSSNESLQQFAYVASHDLQEPLRKIQAFGDLLVEQHRDGLDDTARDYLTRMQQAASRMQGLIQDLLAYSRLSTHREPFTTVDLTALVAEVLDDLSLIRADAVLDVAPLPTVQGDRMQLRQLLQNLLANAFKFRAPDRSVQISVRSEISTATPPDLRLPAGTYHEITVEDNGIGFDPAHRERIFQVFQRLHGRSQYVGSGVGLAICKRVAENHGGAILAEGRPGHGATFRVFLPV